MHRTTETFDNPSIGGTYERVGYRLSTGRFFYAWNAAVSPAEEGRLVYGYVAECDEVPLTPAERTEIAAYIKERWDRWAATGDPDAPGTP